MVLCILILITLREECFSCSIDSTHTLIYNNPPSTHVNFQAVDLKHLQLGHPHWEAQGTEAQSLVHHLCMSPGLEGKQAKVQGMVNTGEIGCVHA